MFVRIGGAIKNIVMAKKMMKRKARSSWVDLLLSLLSGIYSISATHHITV
jgi:hypothetical protein